MTQGLVGDALKMAARSHKGKPHAVFHSDRGSQYTSHSFKRVLDVFQIDQSMSRRANCYDNAMLESFFTLLKKELVDRCDFRTRKEAEIFEWIECFCNRERIHSGIGYLTPSEFEAKCA